MSSDNELKNKIEELEAKIKILEAELLACSNDESASRLRRAEIASRSGNWELFIDKGRVYGSEGAMRLYGMKRHKMDFEIVKKIPLPEYRPLLDSSLSQLITENKPYDIEFKIRNAETGEIIDIHSTAEYDKKTRRVFGIIHDITSQKISEEQIKRKSSELSILLEITLGLLEKADKRIVLKKILEGANHLVGLDTGAIYSVIEANLILESTIPEMPEDFPDEFRKALLVSHPHISKSIERGTPLIVEDITHEKLTPQETVIITQRKMRTILFIPLIASGQKYGVIILGTIGRIKHFDEHEISLCRTISNIASLALENSILITNLKSARDKAEESDKLKTAFLHNISHEIRTPLNAIIGFTGFLDQPDLEESERKKFIEIIQQSNNQLLTIIDDIFNVSHIEAGQILFKEKSTEIITLLNNLYIQFLPEAEKKGLELRLENSNFRDDKYIINTDEGKLIQVLSNLLGNAIKFTHQGHIILGCKKDKAGITFSVEDTGIGIPQLEHEKIFYRFYQVDKSISRVYSGTGLGLSISDAYVRLIGGVIKIDSEPGRGSRFSFTIPLSARTTPKKNMFSEKRITKYVKGEKTTILIAEDDIFSYQFLEVMLKDMNINIIHALNGKQALDICSSGEKIDLVLMDIKMPVMDGYMATSEIKKILPDLPVIAQSAYAEMEDKNKAFMAGCSDFIAKPITKTQIKSVIEKYLSL
ncbi:MAG TPA: ATP-binding protein [Bacteroidales bacterium]|nr:ATP-binding protein [Bacteroidales bacterium]